APRPTSIQRKPCEGASQSFTTLAETHVGGVLMAANPQFNNLRGVDAMRCLLFTPITTWHGRLRATIRRVGGTRQAYMDVASMALPGTHLGHPRFIILVLDAAELFFYRGIDEDPRYFWLLGRCSDEGDIGRAPSFVVDLLSIRRNQVAGQNIFPFLFA